MKKSATIIQWVLAVSFALCAFSSGLHWTFLPILLSAFLMLPVSTVRKVLNKIKLKNWMVISLSVVLLFVGVINSPISAQDIPTADNTDSSYSQAVSLEENSSDNTSSSDTETASSENTSSNGESSSDASGAESSSDSDISSSTSSEAQSETDNSGINEIPSIPTPSLQTEPLVWIPTNGGKKYHRTSTCSNMIDPIQVAKQSAISQGFDACGRCY